MPSTSPDQQARETLKAQDESREQSPSANDEETENDAVVSDEAAQIPEERLLRNDQGPQGQAES